MKKFGFIVLIVVVALGLLACSPQPTEEQAEALAEQMLEEMMGGDADVDIDDGGNSVSINSEDGSVDVEGDSDGDDFSVNIEGEDGSLQIEGSDSGIAWPSDELPANVPEVQGVTVTSKMSYGNGLWVMFEDCDESEAQAYVASMEAAGWDITMETEYEDSYTVMASDTTGGWLTFDWMKEDGSGEIIYGTEEE